MEKPDFKNAFIYEGVVLERKEAGSKKDALRISVGQGFGLAGFMDFYISKELVGHVPAEGVPVQIGGRLVMDAGTAQGDYGAYGKLIPKIEVTSVAPHQAAGRQTRSRGADAA